MNLTFQMLNFLKPQNLKNLIGNFFKKSIIFKNSLSYRIAPNQHKFYFHASKNMKKKRFIGPKYD